MGSGPLYLVYVCPNCLAIRHLKPKDNNIYCCPVCGFEVLYNNGIITEVEKLGGRIKVLCLNLS